MNINPADNIKIVQIVVNLWRLAHMIIIPIQDISDMEAILNVPMWWAIFKNGRHAMPCYCWISHKLWGRLWSLQRHIIYVFEVNEHMSHLIRWLYLPFWGPSWKELFWGQISNGRQVKVNRTIQATIVAIIVGTAVPRACSENEDGQQPFFSSSDESFHKKICWYVPMGKPAQSAMYGQHKNGGKMDDQVRRHFYKIFACPGDYRGCGGGSTSTL